MSIDLQGTFTLIEAWTLTNSLKLCAYPFVIGLAGAIVLRPIISRLYEAYYRTKTGETFIDERAIGWKAISEFHRRRDMAYRLVMDIKIDPDMSEGLKRTIIASRICLSTASIFGLIFLVCILWQIFAA